jgi:hypothetical protein
MSNQIFSIYNHDSSESFQIVSIEQLILWLNDNDETFSFKIQKSLKARAFSKDHPNDRFFLDKTEVSLEKFNDFFDAHDVGFEKTLQDDQSSHYIIHRDDAL